MSNAYAVSQKWGKRREEREHRFRGSRKRRKIDRRKKERKIGEIDDIGKIERGQREGETCNESKDIETLSIGLNMNMLKQQLQGYTHPHIHR